MPDDASKTFEPEAVVKAYATGFSLTVGVSGDRQITYQSGFESDETDAAVNARLDRMMRLADRQKAIYSIPELEDDLAKQRETVTNLMIDRERLDKDHEIQQASRREQIEELKRLMAADVIASKATYNENILAIQERKNESYKAGQAAHQKSGKLAGYKPVGHVKIEIDRCDAALESAGKLRDAETQKILGQYQNEIAKVEAAIVRADNECQNSQENQSISHERWTKAIDETEARLNRARAQLEG